MIQRKLDGLSKDFKQSKRDLDAKLKHDSIALNQQRYLIDTILEKHELKKK
jgi:hypothetical protein